jgi:WD40 repeat protein
MVLLRIALTAIALLAIASTYPQAAPEYSAWTAPVNLGAPVNSTFADAGAAISKDRLSLYFHSERTGTLGSTDLWVSQRASEDAPWGVPVNLGSAVNTPFVEAVAALSRDEHWLFFGSDRPGGLGSNDVWVSYRQHVHDPLDWQPAVNLGSGVNSPSADAGPTYFENEDGTGAQLFFHSARPGGVGSTDIYVSEQFPSGTFGPAHLVAELGSPVMEQHPSIRFDGLEIFFFSDRPGTIGNVDVWAATRRTVLDQWSAPANLGPIVNTIFGEAQPYISSDRETLFFTSARPGGLGSQDIWMTTRSKH